MKQNKNIEHKKTKNQGYQMVYFDAKIGNFDIFLEALV